jgi:hypothetical protein
MAKTAQAAGTSPPVAKFSKEQLLKSRRYSERRDMLAALLKDDKQYSHAEVEAAMDKFLKGKVN